MALDHMKIDLEGIGHLLGDKYLYVPAYQRSYAWEESNVLDLIDDVRTAMTDGQDEYFLGAVVLSERDDGDLEVVDGQQRLATTALLIAAIRDWFVDNGDNKRAEDTQRDLLMVRDRRSQESRSRLRLASADHEYFRQTILGRAQTSPQRPSHERLRKAAENARKRVDDVARASANATDSLLNWLEYVEKNARVITVKVPSHANAFVVFETLNDRGLGLSAADLLKNYIFMLADDRIDEVQQDWTRMLGALESVADEDTIVTYIRHYWLSSRGHVRGKDLYATIKKATTSKQSAVELAAALAEDARRYAALLNPSHELWRELGGTGRDHLRTLHFLRMEQNRPLLLAVLRMFKKEEAAETLRAIVSWSVRFLIVGGLGGGTMEKHFGERAREVRDGSVTHSRELMVRMTGIVPTDTQFQASFATARISQNWLARYYLRALEKTRKNEKEPEVVPNENEEQLTLEHVLPLKPGEDWGAIEPEIAQALHKRIGNLALMAKRKNNEAGNSGFEAKKLSYAQSKIDLTRMISEYSDWNKEAIDKRQAQLAELAVKTWPL